MISRFRTFWRVSSFAAVGGNDHRHRMGGYVYLRLCRSGRRDRAHFALHRVRLSDSPIVAYALGAIIVIGLIYLLGVTVESRLESRVRLLIDSLMERIPFVRNLYDVTKRFVAIMDRKEEDGLKSMSPVWCFFGGDGGVGVLGYCRCPDRS